MNQFKPAAAVVIFSQGMTRVKALDEHDGCDLIALHRDNLTSQEWLLCVTDIATDFRTEFWLAVQLSSEDGHAYLSGTLSLLAVWSRSKQLYACQGPFMGYRRGEPHEGVAVKFDDLDPSILPTIDSFCQ